jgi:GYF domain 2
MTEWYYRDAQSQKIGPLSTDEFEERVIEGEIQAQTRVWRSGLVEWTTYEELLAQEANCLEYASGPATSARAQSRSRCRLVSRGVSPANCSPGESPWISSISIPPSATGAAFELCLGCHEEMPSQMFRVLGVRRVCGSCVHRAKTMHRRYRQDRGADATWLGRYFVRLALLAGAFLAIRVLLVEMSGRHPASVVARPVPEDLAGISPGGGFSRGPER